MNWFIAILVLFTGVAGFGLFLAFQQPAFVGGLGKIALSAAWEAFKTHMLPVLVKLATQRMSEQDEAKWRQARRANQPAPYRGKGNPHPGEKD